MKKILFITTLFLTTITFAKKWDAVYINSLIVKGDIDKVIEHYKKGYYGDNRNPQDAFKIAELYTKKKDYANAVKWYDNEKQLINTSKVNLFNYASANHQVGNYQKALDGYLLYAANTGDSKKIMELANQCEKILKLSSQTSTYKIEDYIYNTTDNEKNIALLRTNLVYITTNTEDEIKSTKVYQAVRKFESFSKPVIAYQNNIPNLIITSLSFSNDGNTVVFSAIDEQNNKNIKQKNNENLYIADNLGGKFLNAKLLPINLKEYSFKNPSFNDNASAIYFSSNTKGGFGGFDIWKTNLENGNWTKPTNLGNLINTKSNEINPFIVQDKNENLLYFSSDRNGGFGGYDIYTAKKNNNVWQDVQLEPLPINSNADDISVVFDNEVKTGYFSSNRVGSKVSFDLYRFSNFNLKIISKIKDSINNKPIDFALVQLYENGIKRDEAISNINGVATFLVDKNKIFKLTITKNNYKGSTINTNTLNKNNGDSVEIITFLNPEINNNNFENTTNNTIVFTGTIIDAATNKPVSNAKMRMLNYATQKVRELEIDKQGKFEIVLMQNNNYKVIFQQQANNVFNELTTYGLQKNDIKLRDYTIQGSKLKVTKNKVYSNGNFPADLKLESLITTDNQPITKEKIDSLISIISENTPNKTDTKKQEILSNKTTQKEINITNLNNTKNIDTITKTPNKTIQIEIETPQLAADIITGKQYKKTNKLKDKIIIKNVETSTPDDSLFSLDIVDLNNLPTTLNTNNNLRDNLQKETTSTKNITTNEDDEIEKQKTKAKEVASKTTSTINIATNEDDEIENTVDSKINNNNTKNKTTTETKTTINQKRNDILEENKKETSNKIDISSINNKNTNTIQPENLQQNLNKVQLENYYKIQIASYKYQNNTFPTIQNLGNIEEVFNYGEYIYRIGDYNTEEEARTILQKIREANYFVAFILIYKNNKVTGIIK